jgi:hypothetical protein
MRTGDIHSTKGEEMFTVDRQVLHLKRKVQDAAFPLIGKRFEIPPVLSHWRMVSSGCDSAIPNYPIDLKSRRGAQLCMLDLYRGWLVR